MVWAVSGVDMIANEVASNEGRLYAKEEMGCVDGMTRKEVVGYGEW